VFAIKYSNVQIKWISILGLILWLYCMANILPLKAYGYQAIHQKVEACQTSATRKKKKATCLCYNLYFTMNTGFKL
jgi:hypothetical protein